VIIGMNSFFHGTLLSAGRSAGPKKLRHTVASLGQRERQLYGIPAHLPTFDLILLEGECLTQRLRNERATDALAIRTEPLRVGFAQNHAHRRQDRDVQNRAELVRKLYSLFE
jgi:hypothetical protein